jgi:hypothetical protein
MKRKRKSWSVEQCVPHMLRPLFRADNRYPADTKRQASRLMAESCLEKAWNTAVEYSTEWGLSAPPKNLGEVGCVPWMGQWRGSPKIPVIWGFGSRSCKSARCVLYEWFVGPIPNGCVVRTMCGERGCVNPAHMRCGRLPLSPIPFSPNPLLPKNPKEVCIASTMAKMVEALAHMASCGWRRFGRFGERGIGEIGVIGELEKRKNTNVVTVLMSAEKAKRIERLIREEQRTRESSVATCDFELSGEKERGKGEFGVFGEKGKGEKGKGEIVVPEPFLLLRQKDGGNLEGWGKREKGKMVKGKGVKRKPVGFDRGDASEDEEWGVEEWIERIEVFREKNTFSRVVGEIGEIGEIN